MRSILSVYIYIKIKREKKAGLSSNAVKEKKTHFLVAFVNYSQEIRCISLDVVICLLFLWGKQCKNYFYFFTILFFLTEHRNMPLDDALSFVARNFDNYLRLLREPYYPPPAQQGYGARDPPPRNYSSSSSSYQPPVGSSVAQQTEKQLSTEEISAMIEKLKKEKEHREYKGMMVLLVLCCCFLYVCFVFFVVDFLVKTYFLVKS